MKKIVIVGGVAGGASTAARLRRRDETAHIILYERGEYISYANCGLPYYIGGTIKNRNHLFVQTPESFSKRFNLDIRINSEIIGIDRDKKEVLVKNADTGETTTESYDKLVLSPGAEPVRPPIPGIQLPGIFTLRSVPDTDRIKSFMGKKKPKRAIIVGAGFIGLEMAENLHHSRIFVTIVEMAEQVMTPLDYEMAAAVHQHLKTKHVEFYLKDAVESFEKSGKGLNVRLSSGRNLKADMVILSIGVRPESKLAKEADLAIGSTGGIQVNEYLQTSDPDIYALGDAIEVENPIINRKMTAYLAGPANKQGRVVADNIVSENKIKYRGSITTAIAKVFDLTVASTGVSEKTLIKEKIPYIASITHGSSHAGYYPGATPMTIKIQFSPKDGKVFGAQIVGYEGVDKRIDMIANTLKQGGTVCDLMDIEHAYAPPFSSAKDPVNIAGFAADNILHGLVQIVHWHEIQKADPDKDFLLDVRTRHEVKQGTIHGSYHIPLDDLRDRMDEIPKDRRILIFCAAGLRGYLTARILMQNGFENVYNLSGGYITYEHAIQKQSNEDIFDHSFIHRDGALYSSEE
ncbi:pyridine nucleotide-disulfide oxidoreductase family protein [candidate division KSB1 bacterium]|nr:pyridine nucleotide-disulfide oxidoreductase family protein [candidate division KSB1 bacterium]